jgi:hypothetical protein
MLQVDAERCQPFAMLRRDDVARVSVLCLDCL